jgi:peroxiredoxin Q/BCP
MSNAGRVRVGAQAPDFTLKDERNEDWRLSDQRGRIVVLLFYPGDETPVCTKQLCSLRNHWSDYVKTGAEIVGISSDSVESHQRFIVRHRLPLHLLMDTGGKVAALYGVRPRLMRGVFVIDAEGIVRYRKSMLGLFRPDDNKVLAAVEKARDMLN